MLRPYAIRHNQHGNDHRLHDDGRVAEENDDRFKTISGEAEERAALAYIDARIAADEAAEAAEAPLVPEGHRPPIRPYRMLIFDLDNVLYHYIRRPANFMTLWDETEVSSKLLEYIRDLINTWEVFSQATKNEDLGAERTYRHLRNRLDTSVELKWDRNGHPVVTALDPSVDQLNLEQHGEDQDETNE